MKRISYQIKILKGLFSQVFLVRPKVREQQGHNGLRKNKNTLLKQNQGRNIGLLLILIGYKQTSSLGGQNFQAYFQRNIVGQSGS